MFVVWTLLLLGNPVAVPSQSQHSLEAKETELEVCISDLQTCTAKYNDCFEPSKSPLFVIYPHIDRMTLSDCTSNLKTCAEGLEECEQETAYAEEDKELGIRIEVGEKETELGVCINEIEKCALEFNECGRDIGASNFPLLFTHIDLSTLWGCKGYLEYCQQGVVQCEYARMYVYEDNTTNATKEFLHQIKAMHICEDKLQEAASLYSEAIRKTEAAESLNIENKAYHDALNFCEKRLQSCAQDLDKPLLWQEVFIFKDRLRNTESLYLQSIREKEDVERKLRDSEALYYAEYARASELASRINDFAESNNVLEGMHASLKLE